MVMMKISMKKRKNRKETMKGEETDKIKGKDKDKRINK